MDADRFDDLARALGLSAARRGMIAGLFSGGLVTLLATIESEARRRANHAQGDDDLAAEKRKKRKKKKRKKKRKPQDQAPPCTDESCPLPPECSQHAFETCSNDLAEAMLADVEACQPVCQDVNSAPCQACLEPIAAAHMPAAEACIAESCGIGLQSFGGGGTASQRSARAASRAWFIRTCERPCCYTAYKACQEDAANQGLICTAAAVIGAVLSGPGGAVAYAFCLVRLAYSLKLCYDRNWCVEGTCIEGDKCCPPGEAGCINSCCPTGSHCCEGGGCCNDGDTCCFRQSSKTLFCCPPGAQCMQTGIPCCSNC